MYAAIWSIGRRREYAGGRWRLVRLHEDLARCPVGRCLSCPNDNRANHYRLTIIEVKRMLTRFLQKLTADRPSVQRPPVTPRAAPGAADTSPQIAERPTARITNGIEVAQPQTRPTTAMCWPRSTGATQAWATTTPSTPARTGQGS